MSNTLFQHLAMALNTADSLTLKIDDQGNGQLRVTLLPGFAPDNAPTESGDDAELRAALALPLVICETPTNLDAHFVDLVREYAQQRASLNQSIQVIDSLKKANAKAGAKAAKATTPPKGKAKAQAESTPTTPPPAPRSAVAASDDDILL